MNTGSGGECWEGFQRRATGPAREGLWEPHRLSPASRGVIMSQNARYNSWSTALYTLIKRVTSSLLCAELAMGSCVGTEPDE